jgi:hypothetical protein
MTVMLFCFLDAKDENKEIGSVPNLWHKLPACVYFLLVYFY